MPPYGGSALKFLLGVEVFHFNHCFHVLTKDQEEDKGSQIH